ARSGHGEGRANDGVSAERQPSDGRDVGLITQQVEYARADECGTFCGKRDGPAVNVVVRRPPTGQRERAGPQRIALQEGDQAIAIKTRPHQPRLAFLSGSVKHSIRNTDVSGRQATKRSAGCPRESTADCHTAQRLPRSGSLSEGLSRA